MGSARVVIGVLAACALAATLAFLAVGAPAASRQHAAAAVYCPDKADRQKDLARANAAVRAATANVKAKAAALARAKKAGKGVAAAQRALKAAKARLADAKQAQKQARAALAECT